jgi:hypothetical protein
MGDGMYFNLADVSLPLDKTDNHGSDESLNPPMTQRSSRVQAIAYGELGVEATFDHDLPRLCVRSIRHPEKSFARPTHVRASQLSDVRAAHVIVENPVRKVQVAPASLDT